MTSDSHSPSLFSFRPTPWSVPPDGYHFEPAQQGPEWIAPNIGAGRCRYIVARKACGAPAVATLMRGYNNPKPWDYCAEHLYGRWIEDGKVMGWRLVKDGDDAE